MDLEIKMDGNHLISLDKCPSFSEENKTLDVHVVFCRPIKGNFLYVQNHMRQILNEKLTCEWDVRCLSDSKSEFDREGNNCFIEVSFRAEKIL